MPSNFNPRYHIRQFSRNLNKFKGSLKIALHIHTVEYMALIFGLSFQLKLA